MAFRKNRGFWGLFVALLVIIPLTAYALIGPRELGGQLLVETYIIPQVVIPTTGTSTDVEGVIATLPLFSGGVVLATYTETEPDLGTLPYPAKLRVDVVDGGAGSGAITCTSISLFGKNQFGEYTFDVLTTITETEQVTSNVYEELERVVSAGCAIASGGDTSDIIQITMTGQVGLPRKIRSGGDIISMCFDDASDSSNRKCYRGSGTITGARESLVEAGAVDVDDSAVDITDATLDAALVDGDRDVTFRIRQVQPIE